MPFSREENSDWGSGLNLLKDYAETRFSIFRLLFIRRASKTTGLLAWLVIVLILLSLLIIFLGIVTALWISQLTGSYIAGFAITAGILLLLIIILTMARRRLFIDPATRIFIDRATKEEEVDNG